MSKEIPMGDPVGRGGMADAPPEYAKDRDVGYTPPFERDKDHIGKVDSTVLDYRDKGRRGGDK